MIANKLDNSRGITGGNTDVDSFGSGLNKKLLKSKKSIISDNSGATEELEFLISNAKEVFNLL